MCGDSFGRPSGAGASWIVWHGAEAAWKTFAGGVEIEGAEKAGPWSRRPFSRAGLTNPGRVR